MLDTREELEDELQTRLQSADNSTLYPSDRLTSLIKQGNLWATQLFPWDDLYKWLKTSTASGRNYYSYPTTMASDTIMSLQIDGEIYERVDYEDFEDYKVNSPNSNRKVFASNGRYYWVSPTPTTSGSRNLHIYGCVQVFSPYDLANATDKTIFSVKMSSANEAIIKKGLSIALKPQDAKMAQAEEAEAVALLSVHIKNQKVYKARNKRLDHPRFAVPDFFARHGATGIGRFSYDPNSN